MRRRVVWMGLGLVACSPVASPSEGAVSTVMVAPASPGSGVVESDAAPATSVAKQDSGLRATLAGARESSQGVRVTFVLRNVGDERRFLYERWNSWGADQWKIVVGEAGGRQVVAVNPVQAWTENYPSGIMLEPGAEQRLDCLVVPATPATWDPAVSYFVTPRSFRTPQRVKGIFESTVDPSVDRVGIQGAGQQDPPVSGREMWAGHIETGWIAVDGGGW
jgi:hypothetical protein